jgi:hypothetical protein
MEITKTILGAVVSIIVSLGTAMAVLLFQQNNKLIEVATNLENLEKNVSKGTVNRYTSIDAKRDFLLTDTVIKNLEKRITNLEERVK